MIAAIKNIDENNKEKEILILNNKEPLQSRGWVIHCSPFKYIFVGLTRCGGLHTIFRKHIPADQNIWVKKSLLPYCIQWVDWNSFNLYEIFEKIMICEVQIE